MISINKMGLKAILLYVTSIMLLPVYGANRDGEIMEKVFRHPPISTKPYVYWYWLNGNVSKEGITKDLEAMDNVGIGEAFIASIWDAGGKVYDGDVMTLSEEWWEYVEHAIREAQRLGMKIGMFNSPGWSQSGGPWVKSEQAMRYLVSSELRIKGPRYIEQKLATPTQSRYIKQKLATPTQPFQQLRVQAYPAPKGDMDNISSKPHTISSSPNLKDAEYLFDGDKATSATITSYPCTINITMKNDFTVRSLILHTVEIPMSAECELQYKNDKGLWKTITKRKIERWNLSVSIGPNPFAPNAESFDAITSKCFRLILTDAGAVSTNNYELGRLNEVELSGAARLSFFAEKQLLKMAPTPRLPTPWSYYLWQKSSEPESKDFTVKVGEVLDITSMVDSNGVLRWDVPKGDWIISRFGVTPTGAKNSPVTPEATGYEVDKMNSSHLSSHFDNFMGYLLKRMPPEQRKSLHHVVADSYERGSQNWTEGFAEEFKKVYGYDFYPWLPVLSGRIIASANQSDRFLWDMRRLIADMIPREYVSALRRKSNENGLRLWLENYGHYGFPGEFLNYGGASDDIGGEFWIAPNGGPRRDMIELRSASSCTNIYGKSITSAEAFTSTWTFTKMPRDLKTRGDFAFTQGINHFVLHLYIHQPYEGKPGMSAWFGTDFNRHNTWFNSSRSFIDYARRISAVLQQGTRVTDVAYFIGEETPIMIGMQDPELPSGYDFDFINSEILQKYATVKNGNLVLKSGAEYKVLVLPQLKTMRPEMLQKIAGLVKAGLTIVGPRPEQSPSMQGFPDCDKRLTKLASEIWGKIDGKSVIENKYGLGRVFDGINLTDAFSSLKLEKDISIPNDYLYTHRKMGDTHAYFISNQLEKSRKDTFEFKLNGMQPELWDAVSGQIRILPEYAEKNGRTSLVLEFNPAQSYIIVFRDSTKAYAGVNFPKATTVQTITGVWNVSFDTSLDAPADTVFEKLIDWKNSSNIGIKYYSGTATYKKDFEFTSEISNNYCLNLGKVEGIATIRVNGKTVGTLWCQPYIISLSNVLNKGKNRLEVDVVNTWWNRLVGDEQPNAKKHTWAAYGLKKTKDGDMKLFKTPWAANSELLPAGLLGPVIIESSIIKNIKL